MMKNTDSCALFLLTQTIFLTILLPYFLTRGLEKEPSPLGEDLSVIFCAPMLRGFQDSRGMKKMFSLDCLTH
jgi:hypothetical protein